MAEGEFVAEGTPAPRPPTDGDATTGTHVQPFAALSSTIRFFFLAALGTALLLGAGPARASSSSPRIAQVAAAGPIAPLILGAFPHHSLLQMEAFYAPLALYLSDTLQRSVRFGTSSSYTRFEARLERRDFDIVFVDSFDYVRLAYPAGYRAIVRRTAPVSVLFIVAPSSPVRELAGLRGTTVAMPPQVAPEVRLGLDRLRAVGLEPGRDVTINYLPHHNACIQHVLAGLAAACVTTDDALSFVGADAGKNYRVLERVGAIPSAVFAVAPSLSDAERDRLTKALIAWPGRSEREGGPANLDWFSLEPANDAEYDNLRRALQNLPGGDASSAGDIPGVARSGRPLVEER